MSSPQENLQNLLKIGKLKAEPPNQSEFDRLVMSARRKLPDAENAGNSADTRFTVAYDAAYALAVAALRWHGYRSENRTLVFQVLVHTLSFPKEKSRLLDHCHQQRNLALYEGEGPPNEQLIRELIAVAKDLQAAVATLGPVKTAPR